MPVAPTGRSACADRVTALAPACLLAAAACGRLGFTAKAQSDAAGGANDAALITDAAPACGSATAQLMSPCVGTFSAQGAYFDVEALSTTTITGFDTQSQNCGTRDVSIYYRPGTHVGFETDAAAWTLIGSTTGFTPSCAASCPITPTPVPIPTCVTIPAGQRGAFYIVMTAGTGTFESTDATLGATVVQDPALVLHAGRLGQGLGAFTGTLVDGKAWQGVIHYVQ